MSEIKKRSEMVWTEKYRPKKIEDAILPQRIRQLFENGEIGDNYLFGGTAGLGKTTLAKILASGRSTLYIDGSTQRGIDVVRNQIIDFISVNSLTSTKKKVVIIDESDKFTKDAQDSLKATIETYHKNAWFIFTANNPERLISPLHSRLTFVSFNFTDEEKKEQRLQYIKRIQLILKKEGDYTIDKDALGYLLTTVYPDMRKIIKLLYYASKSIKGKAITLNDLSKSNDEINDDLYQFLLDEYREEKIYAFVKSKFSGKEQQTLISLGDPFLEFLMKKEKYQSKVLTAAMVVQKYTYESNFAVDPLITLLACCCALSNVLR